MVKVKQYWPTGLGLPRLTALLVGIVIIIVSGVGGIAYFAWRMLGGG